MASPTAAETEGRLGFIADHMPILGRIGERFQREQPFAGLTLAVRIHVEPKTAVLIRTLRGGGATVVALGNKGTTDDALADLLRSEGVEVLGNRDDDDASIATNLATLASVQPDVVLDNGAELIELLLDRRPLGATEETTSGAFKLRGELAGRVQFPVVVINDSPLKAIVENKHGVGQSVIETIRAAANVMLHGRRLVVLGYGWCGRGIAQYGRSAGAVVVVVEPDPIKALEAAIDGFRVAELSDVLPTGDMFVTATGHVGVISVDALHQMRPNAIVANAGHFDDEIDIAGLGRSATKQESRGRDIARYVRPDGTGIDVIADGKMVNLAVDGSRGNSAEIMDLGFALQALSLERLARAADTLPAGPQPVPADIDATVARTMVQEMMR